MEYIIELAAHDGGANAILSIIVQTVLAPTLYWLCEDLHETTQLLTISLTLFTLKCSS